MRSRPSARPTSWSASPASRTPPRSATSCAPRRPASSSTSRTCDRCSSTPMPARPTARSASSSRPSRPTTSSGSCSSGRRTSSRRVALTYPEIDGVGGKGAALRTIFQIAAALEVEALVVVDSRPALDRARVDRAARRADPQGRLRLRGAALHPLQVRRHDHEHRHLPADARAVRLRIRQPIGGDFGVSGDLVRHYLEQDDWTPTSPSSASTSG